MHFKENRSAHRHRCNGPRWPAVCAHFTAAAIAWSAAAQGLADQPALGGDAATVDRAVEIEQQASGAEAIGWTTPYGPYGAPPECESCGTPGPRFVPTRPWQRTPPHCRFGRFLEQRWNQILEGPKCTDPMVPLVRESWRYRPFSAGYFLGAVLYSGELIDNWLEHRQGFFGGYRFGWDFDDYWGCEMRFGLASMRLADSPEAVAAQIQSDDDKGWAPDDPRRLRWDGSRNGSLIVWDVNLLYYPQGDSLWRPYLSIGLGSAQSNFMERLGDRWHRNLFAVPIGIGVKRRWTEWLAFRVDLSDDIVFGTQSVSSRHDVSLTAGLEIRFGGTRKAYWPWHGGRHYW